MDSNITKAWDGFDSVKAFEFPKIVNVNVYSGNCPCSCVHCPVGRIDPKARRASLRQGEMNIDLFKKIVDEIKEKNPETVLRIHSVGEPTLWRNLKEAVKYSKKQNVKTWLFTSAVIKDILLLEELSKNMDIIEISVNSISHDDYKNTKGTDDFGLVCKNIEFINKIKGDLNLNTRIIASRVQSENKMKNDEFIEFWKSSRLVDDSFIRSYHDYNGLINSSMAATKKLKNPCLVHWSRLNIDFSGKVVICFNELFKPEVHADFIYGNINSQSISEIWKGDLINKIRQAELDDDYSILEFSQKIPCVDCSYCQPLFGDRQTSEHQIKIINEKPNRITI